MKNGCGLIRKRKSEILLRTPQVTVEQDGDKYFYSILLLHLPWRHEDEILQNCTTAEEAFQKFQHLIKLPAGKNHAVEIERAIKQIQLLQDNVMNNYIAHVVAPNIEALDNYCPDADNIIREDPDNVNLFEITDEDLHVLENSDCDKNTENVTTGNLDDLNQNGR